MPRGTWWGCAGRAVLLLAGCAAVEVLAGRLTAVTVPPALAILEADTSLASRSAGTLVTALASVLLLLAWSWLTCATVLTVGDLMRQGRGPWRPRRGVPAGWQRAVAGLLGAGALCIPGAAVADGSGQAPAGPERATARIDGLPLPDRPRGAGAVPREAVTHRVVAGESLWTVARDHLGPNATAGRVAVEWPRWYDANADVIGGDPHLITPGTLLRAPYAASPPPQDHQRAPGTDPGRTDGGRP